MKKATLVFIQRGEEVLLGMKKTGEIGQRTWNGPGGKIEPGETAIECLIREAREELGVTLRAEDLTHQAEILFRNSEGSDFLVEIFVTTRFEGEPEETADMIPAWFHREELPFTQMLSGDRDWIPRVLAGDRFGAVVSRSDAHAQIEFLPYGTDLSP